MPIYRASIRRAAAAALSFVGVATLLACPDTPSAAPDAGSTAPRDAAPSNGAEAAQAALLARTSQPAGVVRDPDSGLITALTGRFDPPPGTPRAAGPRALAFVQAHAAAFGLDAADGELAVASERASDTRGTAVRLARRHRGVPVYGSAAVVHVDGNAKIRGVLPRPGGALTVDVTPTQPRPAPSSTLSILDPAVGGAFGDLDAPRLVWRTLVGADLPVGEAMLELRDAHTGEVVLRAPTDDEADDAAQVAMVTCTGRGTRCAKTWFTEAGSATQEDAPPVVARAHALATDALAYLQRDFRRSSWDGAGAPIRTQVMSRRAGRSAYWRHSAGMSYLRADRVYYDVVVHELGHGVVRSHAPDLLSGGLDGAANEAFADLLACGADGNWTIGEEIPGRPPIRDLRKPRHKRGIKTVARARWSRADNDFGFVHDNSTVISHAFYLMAEGCPGGADAAYCARVKVGMGMKKALRIAYKTATELLTSPVTLQGLRDATLQACRLLQKSYPNATGPRECGVVINAFNAIGVGRADTDVDGVPDGPDNCVDVFNPDQSPSTSDPGVGAACLTHDGSRVISGDTGDFAVARIERKGQRTEAMCNQAPDTPIKVKTTHTVWFLAGDKQMLQIHLDAANKVTPSKRFGNNPNAKIRGLNCIWGRTLTSSGRYVRDGLSKDAAFALEGILRRRGGTPRDDGKIALPDSGTTQIMTVREIVGAAP